MVSIKKNKRGWIRVVEAFTALLLVSGALLYIVDKNVGFEEDISEKVYQIQNSILREIEVNNSLRDTILKSPTGIESTGENFPTNLKKSVKNRIPEYLNCSIKICKMDNTICEKSKYIEKNIYAHSVPITANLTRYEPRQVKLFCWVK